MILMSCTVTFWVCDDFAFSSFKNCNYGNCCTVKSAPSILNMCFLPKVLIQFWIFRLPLKWWDVSNSLRISSPGLEPSDTQNPTMALLLKLSTGNILLQASSCFFVSFFHSLLSFSDQISIYMLRLPVEIDFYFDDTGLVRTGRTP